MPSCQFRKLLFPRYLFRKIFLYGKYLFCYLFQKDMAVFPKKVISFEKLIGYFFESLFGHTFRKYFLIALLLMPPDLQQRCEASLWKAHLC